MIHYISIENFASFKDRSVLDFRSTLTKKTNRVFDSKDQKTNKVMMLIGHNASGKTSFLKASSFLAWFMSNSFMLKVEEDFPFSSFFYNGEASNFKLRFVCDDVLYDYELSLIKNTVLTENLYQINDDNSKIIIFERYMGKDGKSEFRTEVDFLDYNITIRHNASFISIARQHKSQLAEKISRYLETWKTNVHMDGRVIDKRDWEQFIAVGAWYLNNPLFLRVANHIFRQLDEGFVSLDIMKIKNPITKRVEALTYGRHCLEDGQQEELLLLDESFGTQSLFYILNKIFPVLRDGGVAILDEFDNELHAHMLPLLFNLFYTRRLNPNNGQLICTSHHHQVLINMNKEQVYLSQKKAYSESEIICIQGLREVTNGPNLLKNYYNKLFKSLGK